MRTLIGALLAVVLLTSTMSTAAEAQRLDRRQHGWLAVDAFFTAYQLEALLDQQSPHLAGGGLRVLFNAAPITGLDAGFVRRTGVGGYVIYTPTRDNVRSWHFGAQVDFRLLGAPAGGFLDPIISLGAGAMRVDTPDEPAIQRYGGEIGVSETFATLTPGIGARIHFGRGFALRGDLRSVAVFGQELTHHPEFSGGLSLLF